MDSIDKFDKLKEEAQNNAKERKLLLEKSIGLREASQKAREEAVKVMKEMNKSQDKTE